MPDPEGARRWSLVFRDPALEEEFQETTARAVHRGYRWLSILCAAQWVLIFPLDFATSGSAANLRVLLFLRYALGFPLVAIGAAVGFASASRFRRWKLAGALASGWGVLGTPSIMGLAIPEPERFLGAQNFGTGTAAFVLYCTLLALVGAPLDRILFGFVLPGVVVGLWSALWPAGQPTTGRGIVVFSACSAAVSAILCAWLVDRGRRDAFLAWRAAARERERADKLLQNMLPEAISARLKQAPGVIADEFEAVTVLFADIVGFTPLSSRLGPRDLVRLLNDVFSAFDEMARRHGVEKIKTIGDAYMVVGGVPAGRADHAAAVAAMALEMRGALAHRDDGLKLRIGVHSGAVVAGVIGTSKYSYDLWGDTVNTASRMESHGVAGEIHVSEACRDLLAGRFELVERGLVEIKGKGPMRTWWLKGLAS